MDKKGALSVDKTILIILAVIGLVILLLVVIFFKDRGFSLLEGIRKIFTTSGGGGIG